MLVTSLTSHIAAVSLLASLVAARPAPLTPRANSFDFAANKVRGVNLGGWLLLEPWITPSLFQQWENGGGAVDEYTLSQALGKDETYRRLSEHWNTWITQDDFNQIARAGLNHVRIPVGYWAVAPLDGEPFVQGQLDYLDKAIGWARAAGIKVMVELHGAPGSQNGFDNSGRYGSIDWLKGNTVSQTLDAIRGLTERYASQTDVVTSIGLLNEPAGFALDVNAIKQYWQSGRDVVSRVNSDVAVVIHDSFQDVLSWNGFMGSGSGPNPVILDTHQYQVFSPDQVALSPTTHVERACSFGRDKLRSVDKWTVVGEWSGAQTDCAKWLNGLGKGARYDGTFPNSFRVGDCAGKYQGTVDGLSSADKENIGRYIEAQLDAYEQGAGWIWWTWKTESAPEWDMQDLIAGGLFPQPLTNRRYPNQCGF
ncbi:MAG: hypothetical protein M1823_004224 [Watsoniomyces obsoletus]|nr:MAG: hypothetical protein M1823_004224 [Watsoniomyces obsoletus]